MEPIADHSARASSRSFGALPEGGFAALVPELAVRDLDVSRRFWCDLLGFAVAYDRPDARFVYLTRAGAQVMLCQVNGRWETAALEHPFGRGLNLQIRVDRLAPVLVALEAERWPLYQAASDVWYRVGVVEMGQRECLVQDPDGYLVRLAESLGRRPAP